MDAKADHDGNILDPDTVTTTLRMALVSVHIKRVVHGAIC